MHIHRIATMAAMSAPLKAPDPAQPLTSLRNLLAFNVRTHRVALEMSQESLGFAAGLDRTFISQVERSRINVSIDNIERLAQALGVSAAVLLQRPER
jgi:ribosome-binding protein aMBF1 (putative translation factor)